MALRQHKGESDTRYAIRCEINRIRESGDKTINWRVQGVFGQTVRIEFEDEAVSKRTITTPTSDWMTLEDLLKFLKTV